MAVRISRIDIHAFRGVPQLALDIERKSVLIKGDNGTGKSSIIEALEFFFTGEVSNLQGTQGVSLGKHGPHVHYSKGDVKVKVTFDPGNVTLSRTMATSPVVHKTLESLLNAAKKGTFILRRSQILAFINADPAERYSAIANILGLEGFDKIELEMLRVRDELRGEEEVKTQAIKGILQSISQTLGRRVSSIDQVLEGLNAKAMEFGFPKLKNLREIKKYTQRLYKSVRRKAQKMESARNHEELLRLLRNPVLSEEQLNRLSGFAEDANELISSRSRSRVRAYDLLQAGRELISNEGSMRCPLCGQTIEPDLLLESIESRMRDLALFSRQASNLRKLSKMVESELEDAGGKLDAILGSMSSLKGAASMTKRIKEYRLFLADFLPRIARARDIEEPLQTVELSYRTTQMFKVLDKVRSQAEHEIEKAGLTQDEHLLLEFLDMLGDVGGKAQSYDALQSDYSNSVKRSLIAERLYDAFSSAKKAKMHEIYQAILGNVNDFSARLHPNEESKSIKLDVLPKKRASTTLLVDTLGKTEQDPRGLESEGHLDALGICIFLAFVRKFNDDIPLILLDDVVTTLDSGHRARLAELLIQEFSDRQLIVTTHDNVWYEQFKAQERAYRKEGEFKNIEIVGWNLTSGPRVVDNRPVRESIEAKLTQGDKSGAANESRQYLEWILEKLCEGMEVSVSFKMPPRYEVRDLLPPARARILSMLKDAEFKLLAEQAFIELEKTILVANLLSHNNLFASEFAIGEVRAFFESVENLHNVFSCPDCGSFLRYYRELSIIRCSNRNCKGSRTIGVRN